MSFNKLFSALAIVALFGAGCFSATVEETPEKPTPPKPVPTQTPTPAPAVDGDGMDGDITDDTSMEDSKMKEPDKTALVPIDDTWQTYSSKTINVEFRWPTKGSYAPEWEVTFVKDGDSTIANGCYTGTGESSSAPNHFTNANGIEFCQTSYGEGAAGNYYLSDYFATKKGSQYILITIKKHLYSSGNLDCSFKNEYPYSTNGTTCIAFKQAEYNAVLNTMISTYKNTTE